MFGSSTQSSSMFMQELQQPTSFKDDSSILQSPPLQVVESAAHEKQEDLAHNTPVFRQ